MARSAAIGSGTPRRARAGLRLGAAAAAVGLSLCACTTGAGWLGGAACSGSDSRRAETEAQRRAWLDREEATAREVDRLRADLHLAEEALVAVESGLQGDLAPAEAASALAKARIAVERAGHRTPWLPGRIDEARGKLEEAERQLQAGNVASAVFFASRAARMARAVQDEGERFADSPGVRRVRSDRAQLRAQPSTESDVLDRLVEATPVLPERSEGAWALVRTPSGAVGWIHQSLIGTP
jgi:hypothetical protein